MLDVNTGIVTAISGFACIVAIICIYLKKPSVKLPPNLSITFFELVPKFMDGTFMFFYLQEIRTRHMLVFNANKPWYLFQTIVIFDVDLARLILDGSNDTSPHGDFRPLEKSEVYSIFDAVTSGVPSILTKKTYGPDWSWARRGLAPSFSTVNLYKSLPLLTTCIDNLCSILRAKAANRESFNVAELMVSFTLDFLTVSMFEENFDALGGPHTEGSRFLRSLKLSLVEYGVKRMLNPFRKFYLWGEGLAEASKAKRHLHEFSEGLLKRYRAKKSEGEIANDTSIIGHLVRSPYPDERARSADVLLLLLAGHDTTGHTAAWTLIELARHPEALVKVKSELDMIKPDPSVPFDVTELSQLTYLNQVIKESMRLWPVAVGIPRQTDRDIEYNGILVPKGYNVGISTFAIMRTGIEKPDEFIPERWDPISPEYGELQKRFMPFGLGKRNCVGQTMALLELKLVLANLLRRYEFELVASDIVPEYEGTLKPKNVHLRAIERGICVDAKVLK